MMEIIERKGMKEFYCKQMTFTVIHQNTIYNPNPKIFAHRCVFTLSQTGCQFAPVVSCGAAHKVHCSPGGMFPIEHHYKEYGINLQTKQHKNIVTQWSETQHAASLVK